MADNGKTVGVAFLIIITGLFAGIVLPELFSNMVNQTQNRQLYQSMRIIIVILVIFILGGAYQMFTGGINA